MSRQSTPDQLGEASPAGDAVAEVFGNRTMLDPAVIRIDGGTQMRDGLNDATVTEYATVMREVRGWGSFPPCVVFYDGAKYWMADGFHRYAAFGRAGLKVIGLLMPAEVRSGTRRDAVLHAVAANANHGLRRTNADKRRSVLALLEDEEWRQWSNHEIARRCAVSAMFVGNMRAEIAPINGLEVTERRGADGKVYHVENIGKRPAEPAPDREVPDNVTVGVWKCLCEARWEMGRIKCPHCGVEHLSWDLSPWLRDSGWRLYRLAGGQYRADHDTLGSIVMTDIIKLRMEMTRRSHTGASTTTWVEPEPKLQPVSSEISVPLEPWTKEREIGSVTIWKADSRNLTVDTSIPPVDLVITSPPYNVGIEYSEHFDKLQQDRYIDLLHNVFLGCNKVMRHGARIAVVVPFGIGRNPWQPMSLFVAAQMQAAGFQLRGQIIWDKGTTGNRTSWGSFRSPSDPSLRDTCECIIVAHKSQSQAAVPHLLKDDKGSYTAWLERSEYFMELAQDHWQVSPESAQRVGHPAPFPVELVRRLVHFYGWPGCTLLDPFAGSGTVGVAAVGLDCKAYLVDIDEAYCRLAERRVKAAYLGRNMLEKDELTRI